MSVDRVSESFRNMRIAPAQQESMDSALQLPRKGLFGSMCAVIAKRFPLMNQDVTFSSALLLTGEALGALLGKLIAAPAGAVRLWNSDGAQALRAVVKDCTADMFKFLVGQTVGRYHEKKLEVARQATKGLQDALTATVKQLPDLNERVLVFRQTRDFFLREQTKVTSALQEGRSPSEVYKVMMEVNKSLGAYLETLKKTVDRRVLDQREIDRVDAEISSLAQRRQQLADGFGIALAALAAASS